MEEIEKNLAGLLDALGRLSGRELMEAINHVRRGIHSVSPMKHHPVDLVLWVSNDRVHANDYNPNSVAPPEMRLLEHSIIEDGYTQPIVAVDVEGDDLTVVDGFHRHRVGKESEEVRSACDGYLPVVGLGPQRRSRRDLMAATVRHNRARGKHSVDGMQKMVVELADRGWSDGDIMRELGMDQDEVLRLRQLGGLARMFSDREFSEAWEEVDGEAASVVP